MAIKRAQAHPQISNIHPLKEIRENAHADQEPRIEPPDGSGSKGLNEAGCYVCCYVLFNMLFYYLIFVFFGSLALSNESN